MKRRAMFVIVLLFIGSSSSATGDWLQFRGPGGLGISTDKGLPVAWSAKQGVVWKTELPGHGSSSPIVVGGKTFVTCYSGYGLDKRDPGDQKNLKRHLVCADRRSGKLLWTRDFDAVLPEAGYQGPFITLHGYASSTPISDGKYVYSFLGKAGVFAHDLDGKQIWHANVGSETHGWGSGTSPVLYKDLLIVNASVESSSLVALDKNTGKEVWTAKGMTESWNTPIFAKTAGGASELVVAAQRKMLGLDPDTGKELWRADTYDWYVCPSIVTHGDVVYGLQHSICVAVKAGGRGDVTAKNVLWQKNFGHVVSSPLFYDGNVYWCAKGTAYCVKASDGSVVYKERLKGSEGEFYASPVLADGKLYYVSRESGTFVVDANPQFTLLAHNTLDDTSIFNGSPAVDNGQMLLRSDRYLYCLGK